MVFDPGIWFHGDGGGAGPGTGGIPDWESGECYIEGDEVIFDCIIYSAKADICPSTVDPEQDLANWKPINQISCIPKLHSEMVTLQGAAGFKDCRTYFITDRNIIVTAASASRLYLRAHLLDGTEVDAIEYDLILDYISRRIDKRRNDVGASYEFFTFAGVNPIDQFLWGDDTVTDNIVLDSSLPIDTAENIGSFRQNNIRNCFIDIDKLDTVSGIENNTWTGCSMTWNFGGITRLRNTVMINGVLDCLSECTTIDINGGFWNDLTMNLDNSVAVTFNDFTGSSSLVNIEDFNVVQITDCHAMQDGNMNLTDFDTVTMTNVVTRNDSTWTGSGHSDNIVLENWIIEKTGFTTLGNTAAVQLFEGIFIENSIGTIPERTKDITGLQVRGRFFQVDPDDTINLLEVTRWGSNQLRRVDLSAPGRLVGNELKTFLEDYLYGGLILQNASNLPGTPTVINKIDFQGVLFDVSNPLTIELEHTGGATRYARFDGTAAAGASAETLVLDSPSFTAQTHQTDLSDWIKFRRNRTNASFQWIQDDAHNYV